MWVNSKIIGANQKRGESERAKRGDKDFIMSRSHLVAFAENPAKWREGGEVREETKSMSFGSVLDCLATSPDTFESRFAITPETYPAKPERKGEPSEMKPWTSRANYCKDWESEKEAQGFSVVSAGTFAEAKKAFTTLQSNREIASLIECSEKQVLIVADWKDEETGLIIPFAALLDLVPHHSSPTWGKKLVDIKTTKNGNPAIWPRVCDDSGYDVQAAIYMDLYRAAKPNEDRVDFVHVVQENSFPFHVVTPPPCFSTEFMDWGRAKYLRAIRLYCRCVSSGFWPGYEQVGMPFGNTQIIEPKDLWNYKKTAGLVGAAEFQMPQNPDPEEENHDVIP